MLGSVANMFGGVKTDHLLADAKELRRVISELPLDNAFKALDEIDAWFESLLAAHDFPDDQLFEVTRQLEEAGQQHVRKLGRDYLHSPRLSKSEEKRFWSIISGFWKLAAANYERCLAHASQKDKVAEHLQAVLPLLLSRLLAALAAVVKWDQFRYGPVHSELWLRMGHAYLAAVNAKVADKPVKLYPNASGMTTPAREYLRVLVFHASAMDSLLPVEIDLAEHLIHHFLPQFVFGPQSHPESVCWIDAGSAMPPKRMAVYPTELTPGLRFFHSGPAHAAAAALLSDLERGLELPADVHLGSAYPVKTVLPVLRHLVANWSQVPPQREHKRHRVKHRMAVLPGLVNAFVAFSGEFGERPAGLPIESWVVDDVSRGGFGAVLSELRADWLKVGALIAMQPEGGENWLLGIVRRYQRESEVEAKAGVESLSRQVVAVEVRPRTASSYAAVASIPALWLQEGNEAGEIRLVMPPATFDLRESMEFERDGQRYLLTPVALAEHAADYEIARYRALTAD